MNLVNMVKFQIKQICSQSIMFMMYFVYPWVLTLIIGYLTRNSFSSGVTSYEYYSLGMMIFIFTSAGLISAYNFIDDPMKGGNFRTMVAPVKERDIYLSQIISGTIYSAVALIASMGIFSIFFKVNYNGSAILIFIAFVVLSFMSNAIGMLLCTLMNNVMSVNMLFNLVSMVLCVLGGAFFSLESLGGIPAKLSKISPVKWVMDGLLNSMYDGNNVILLVSIMVSLVVGIILVFITSKTFKVEKYI